jgi:hypothetical protein
MAETVYTETKTLTPNKTITVAAVGTVLIEAKHGTEWVTVVGLVNEVKLVEAYGRDFRFSVTSPDSFSVS